jgi:HD superfamily phosphohydrolase YqeK
LDAEKGRLAGLLHDSMKEREVKEQWELAEQGRNAMNDKLISRAVQEFREGEDFGSKMIHGPAAAGYLYCCAGWTDMEVLEAIALHSSAFEAMGPLCKVLYVADKLEPLREYVGRAEAKALETEDLDSLFTYAVGHVVEYLKGKNYHIAQSTLDLYNSFTTKKAYA